MDNKPFDYSMYGTWNGKPMLPIFNRKERRKYIKEHKHDKNAEYCPFCQTNTIRISDDNCDICCELCGKIIEKGSGSNE